MESQTSHTPGRSTISQILIVGKCCPTEDCSQIAHCGQAIISINGCDNIYYTRHKNKKRQTNSNIFQHLELL